MKSVYGISTLSAGKMPFDKAPQYCSVCEHLGYVIIPGTKYAEARKCSSCSRTCRLCGQSGVIFERDEKGRDTMMSCQCVRLEQEIRRYNAARIPQKYWDATLRNFSMARNAQPLKKILDLSQKIIDDASANSKGLLVFGGVGSGKTRLICAMVREYVFQSQRSCRFVEFSRLLGEIKQEYDKGKSEEELLVPLTEVAVLAIDELGKGKNSEWEISILDNLVSRRYNMEKITLFTTNYLDVASKKRAPQGEDVLVESLKVRLNPRIYSRLKEMCYFADMNYDDYRLVEHEKNTGDRVVF